MPENPSTPDDAFSDPFVHDARDAAPSSRRAAREARADGAPADAARPAEAQAAPVPVSASARSAQPAASARPTGPSGATLEALFTGAASTDELGAPPPKPPRRRRRVGGWIALGVVLVLLGGAAAGGLWAWNTYEDRIRAVLGWEEPSDFEEGLATGEARITIESGDAGPQVSQKLYDAGVTKNADSLYDYMIENQVVFTFQPGVFQLQQQMTSQAVLLALDDPANRLENTARLREGLTVEQSLVEVSEQMDMPLADLQAAVVDPSVYGVSADTLEGWLFPATYTFTDGSTATDVIRTMVERSITSLDSAGVPEADRERILTIASIIQREARFEDDFYRVSRVIQNRLDPSNQETFGLLQMDSTAQYGYGEMHDGTASSSEEALTDDNLWNTYVHPGLPVGPISNPGDLAIDAAMNPVDGPWFYFVTVNLDTGETVFTSTASEHQRAVDQWIDWCRDHPDSGC